MKVGVPIGLQLMVGFSLVVIRRARSVGRRPWRWVSILWLLAFGLRFIGCNAVVLFLYVNVSPEPTNEEMLRAAMLPVAGGMIVGAT
jgi:hypothetical protein